MNRPRPSLYIVLCEDQLHGVFVEYFLKKHGIQNRLIRRIPCPKGKGAGEQHVRTQYPNELKAYRSRTARMARKECTVLIVLVDADADTVENHNRELDNAAKKNDLAPRTSGECVVHLIPKRHIETWLAYLDLGTFDEAQNYKNDYSFRQKESACHCLIDRLFDSCQQHKTLENIPPSLSDACREFSRIQSLLGQ